MPACSIKVLLAGLVLSQVIGTVFVHLSNMNLLEVTKTLEQAGYLTIPTNQVAPRLNSFWSAFYGGLFFTFSLGAGLTVLAMAATWVWDRLFHRRRFFPIIGVVVWGLSLLLVNAQGADDLITTMVLLVCPVVWWLMAKWLPKLLLNMQASAFPAACCGVSEQNSKRFRSLHVEDSPQLAVGSFNGYWPIRLIFLGTMMMVGFGWAWQADERVFLDLRDYTLWSNSPGRYLGDFYYRHTLAPAEVFKSLRQKTLRTCYLPELDDAGLTEQVKKTLTKYDFLCLRSYASADLVIQAKGVELSFYHQGRLVMHVTPPELFHDPDAVLGRFSSLTDQHRLFRRVTFVSLLAGLPLSLYIFFFSLLWWLLGRLWPAKTAALGAGVLVLLLSLAVLAPVWYGRSLSAADPARALISDSWWRRVAALKAMEARTREISDQPYQHLLTSDLPVERYWLAVNLGHSRRPETYPDLKRLLNDPDPNVLTMVLRSLGWRRDPTVIPEIINKIKTSDHWYVQWYGYRALKELGWNQG